MQPFRYARAADFERASRALAEPRTAAIAGGTEILNWMRLGVAEPASLIDIGRIRGGRDIEVESGVLKIGSLATLNDVGEHKTVREHAAVLGEACLKAASAQVRNRATIGGNLFQKTRCEYFRAEAPLPWGCNKREPGTGCAALEGHNDRHAIFGWTDACVATQPSDPVVALACLDAEAELLGPAGARRLPVAQLHLTQAEAAETAPGAASAQVETRLRPGELIVGYRIPLRRGRRSAYVKVRERESYEYALVSAAAAVTLDDGVIGSAQVALGSVAQKPWRLAEAEAALVGKPLTREALLPPLTAAMSAARPLSHNGYKVELGAKVAMRALLLAGEAA